MTTHRIDFLGLPLDTGFTQQDVLGLLQKKGELRMVSFINPSAWALARKDAEYLELLKQMNTVLPDGEGVALGCRLLHELPCPRLSFDMSSLADPFFKAMEAQGLNLMIAGGVPTIDEHFHDKLMLTYPKLKVAGTVHGFGDFAPKIAMATTLNPDVVLIGMGAKRQEAFALALRDAGYKGLAITCGGFFDQYLETESGRYYPAWVDKMNLRFAYRLYKEPGRLWRRYLFDYQTYIARVTEALALKYRGKAEVYVRKVLDGISADKSKT
jgi:N-acetylglucosaminyldiphosphoundecaprenol N-acetyl-beta-D-mannosaminyltransferase